MSHRYPHPEWEMVYRWDLPPDLPQRCRFCKKPWQGVRTQTEWSELDRQDHKGPRDVSYAACCGVRAGMIALTEPEGYHREPHPVGGGDVFYRRRSRDAA